jgi:hypothetical protein
MQGELAHRATVLIFFELRRLTISLLETLPNGTRPVLRRNARNQLLSRSSARLPQGGVALDGVVPAKKTFSSVSSSPEL